MRTQHRLSVLLKAAQLARSTFFYHLARLQIPDKYAEVKVLMLRLFSEHRSLYGYRRLNELLRQCGYSHSGKTILKLMKALSLECPVRRKKYCSYRGGVNPTVANLLQRNFVASAPEEKWVTDVTEFRVGEDKYYLSAIMDLYNDEIVAWEGSQKATASLIDGMLKKAFSHLSSLSRVLLHSDQGWHYQRPYYRRQLAERGIQQSMSRKGNCLDNAMIENFFGHLKTEMFYLKTFRSVSELSAAIGEYIDFWNDKRIKMGLGGLSPVEYRTHNQIKLT
ncbi:integrase [Pantoea vagans]|uniref:Integrase n=1 Tax=Pantoea vagans TaxID=470934 RepID=A0A0U3K018_9GAMM|nr:integrase [Pantoea vagans]